MDAFGVGSITFFLGAAVAVGGWLRMMVVLVRYRLHSSFGWSAGLKRFFAPEAKADRKKALTGALVMGAGAFVLLVSVMVGDAQRNRPCREGCRAAGYETGLLRGSPHEAVNGRAAGPYQCWCRRCSTWSDAPLALPAP